MGTMQPETNSESAAQTGNHGDLQQLKKDEVRRLHRAKGWNFQEKNSNR
jgi:hypothetical protein